MNNVDVQLNTIPVEHGEAWAQFNKITGVYTGIFQKEALPVLNHDYYDYVEIEINLETEHVAGTKDNFQILKNEEVPQLIYERTLNNMMYAKIDRAYSLYQRLDILSGAIEKLLEANNIEDTAIAEMADYIVEVKKVNEIMKESYAKDPTFDYVTIQEEQEKTDAQMEGGLHEFFGPREPMPAILDSPVV